MDDIIKNHLLMRTSTKIVFIPECGLDINYYNGIHQPIPWRCLVTQADLEHGLKRLQRRAKELNDIYSIGTPRTLDLTHSRRNGHMKPIYSRLYDGLHRPRSMVRRFAGIIHDFAKHFLIDTVNDWY